MAMETPPSVTRHSVINSSFPVLLPKDEALFKPEAEFQTLIRKLVTDARNPNLTELQDELPDLDGSPNSLKRRAISEANTERLPKSPFVEALKTNEAHFRTEWDLEAENKTFTANTDVTNISSKDPLVDLFYDLGENTPSKKLKSLLQDAWREDPIMTLKIIFNARSIHLGKSNRIAAYRALGWLAEHHPITLLANLRWLVRPVIEKKAAKPKIKDEKDSDFAMVDADGKEQSESKDKVKNEHDDFDIVDPVEPADPNKAFDVRFGVSHGYWKDLLNLVVFAAHDQLTFDGDPSALLTQKTNKSSSGERQREWNQQMAKELRKHKIKEHHERVIKKLQTDGFYRALHTTVARLFADQLKEDIQFLNSGKKSDRNMISLAAKWAPTFSEFHDKHTFILSSIAEILFPDAAEICQDATNRELYLRLAREAYRKSYASPLRKELAVVEREIVAENFKDIKYERVPSLAMDRYTGLFMKKDYEHFKDYIMDVAKGSAKISGATLLPSTLVQKARSAGHLSRDITGANMAALKVSAEADITRKVIDGQWKSLVQRVRDSGALDSSIAICDVSGSMTYPTFKDRSTPMDCSIGLSLLVAEITAQPFGGGFITFSETPTYVSVGGEQDPRGLVDKVHYIERANWSMNTNFVAVFEDLILPMAINNKLRQEDMVKQVFVFSDMQFDAAESSHNRWTSSYERIKQKYQAAGYEVPKLIFWNLAGNSTSKPITMEDQNTALVSGYSQGMLKVFLDGGGFENQEEELIIEKVIQGEDGMTEVVVEKKIDPLSIVKKAVSHKAYSMLEVID